MTRCEWFQRLSEAAAKYHVTSARLLLEPAESASGSNKPVLSSGLYIVTASLSFSVNERHYVIYWPEDSTWNDSAGSSVRRNRITFMR